MDLAGNFFLSIRNENIIPLAAYNVRHSKSKDYELKNFMSQSICSINAVSGSEFIIEYDKEEFYKYLIIDIENIYTKCLLQLLDFRRNNIVHSQSWSCVTQYYFSFFCVNLFFRMRHQGFVFFDARTIDHIGQVCTALNTSMQKFNKGDYFFEIESSSSLTKLRVRFKKCESVHKSLWDKLNEQMPIYLNKASEDEFLVFDFIKRVQSAFGNNFPSEIRKVIIPENN